MNVASLTATVTLCSLVAGTCAKVPWPNWEIDELDGLDEKINLLYLYKDLVEIPILDSLAGLQLFQPTREKSLVTPNLTEAMKLGLHSAYSIFNPYHRKLTDYTIDAFLEIPSYGDFFSTAEFYQHRINPDMYIYALSEAILYRDDTQDVPLPSLITVSPSLFFEKDFLDEVQQEIDRSPETNTTCTVLPFYYSNTDPDLENRLAYFREDVGLNLNHWYWHIYYPGSGQSVNKDRRGELFYYMHEQMLARYNAERLSCNMSRYVPFQSYREPIAEGYNPNLRNGATGNNWAPRPDNTQLSDINNENFQLHISIAEIEQWHDRIIEGINNGYFTNVNGESIPLDGFDGIDQVVNNIESSTLSTNRNYYGNLHNMGHMLIAMAHDPNGETLGVMGNAATSMRDIVFYHWHGYLDQIFQKHKLRLNSYTTQQLTFDGVSVTDVAVISDGGYENELFTFWQRSEIDLSFGLDFTSSGPALACITHLQHKSFSYHIRVNNTGQKRKGMVRIFLAPSYNESGAPFPYDELRLLFIELDKFQVDLNAGLNVILRSSIESSVTIPFQQTFRKVNQNNCGCGWPQHMLIPKGMIGGMQFQLFVMVSDYANDEVLQVVQPAGEGCKQASCYCGLNNQLYPDLQSMGYPFDRKSPDGVVMLEAFLKPNMHVQTVTIRFTNVVIPAGLPFIHTK